MKTAYVLSGRITPEGKLELDEPMPLLPGPVRVSIESDEPPAQPTPAAFAWPDEADLRRRKAAMDAAIGCLSDVDAKQMMDLLEREFGQVNPDDWR